MTLTIIFSVATLVFSNQGPPTNLLLHVTKDGGLDHDAIVTNTCRLKSALVSA